MIYPHHVIDHELVEKYATFLHAKDLTQKWQTEDLIDIRRVCDIFLTSGQYPLKYFREPIIRLLDEYLASITSCQLYNIL